MLFQYTLTRWEPGQTFGPKEQYTSGVCNYSLLKTCQARRSGFALVRLETSQGRTAWATGKPWESVTFVDSGGQCLFCSSVSFSIPFLFRLITKLPEVFSCLKFSFLYREKKKKFFLLSFTLAHSHVGTVWLRRLWGWLAAVRWWVQGQGGYRACCWSRRMRCTECGFLVGVSCGSWTLSQLS